MKVIKSYPEEKVRFLKIVRYLNRYNRAMDGKARWKIRGKRLKLELKCHVSQAQLHISFYKQTTYCTQLISLLSALIGPSAVSSARTRSLFA